MTETTQEPIMVSITENKREQLQKILAKKDANIKLLNELLEVTKK